METEEEAFAREMSMLGVRPIGAAGMEPPAPGESTSNPEDALEPTEASSDEELFLEALGHFDVTFEDEIPDADSPAEPPAPRRMRQVRQGRLVPEAQLDLHGLDRSKAMDRVRFFLQDAIYQGHRTVLIVTGRGQHSAGEPVLRTATERFLSAEGRRWVIEWGRAPRQYGGNGALVVFLRSRERVK